jgi:hypothetical protein
MPLPGATSIWIQESENPIGGMAYDYRGIVSGS